MSVLHDRLIRFARLVAVLLATMVTSAPSWAGGFQLKDEQGLLSSGDVSALHEESGALPFAVRVITTGDHPTKGELDGYVHEQLSSPNMVVIGIDRAHRHTAVHFGTATGVPSSAFRRIEEAGSPAFREGNWRAGISAILQQTGDLARAGAETATATRTGAAQATARPSASTAIWGLLAVLVVAGLIVFVGVTLARRARAGLLGSQAAGTPDQPWRSGGGFPGNPYPGPPGYPPGAGYPNNGYGAGGGIGRNIAAAGLGGLVGYELGKLAGEHGERETTHEAAGFIGADGDRGPDAGGASGDWDDGSTSGASVTENSGGDWGGAGDAGQDSWDSGDSGGGDWDSGDGGGGGSDW